MTWDKPQIVQTLKRLHREGRDISYNAMCKSMQPLLSAAAYHYGSYRQAVAKAGIDYAEVIRRPRWNKPRIVALVKAAARKGEDLHWAAVTRRRDDLGKAAFASIQPRLFGNWKRVLQAAGLNADEVVRYRRWDRQDVLAALRGRKRNGEPINSGAIQRDDAGLHAAAIRHFGSYNQALIAARIDPADVRRRRAWSAASVKVALREARRKGGDVSGSTLRPQGVSRERGRLVRKAQPRAAVPQRTFMWHSRPRLCADMHPVYFIDPGGHLIFDDPVEELRAERVEQVMPLLERAAAAVNSGLYAAGFIAYEAAPAFDPALVTHPPLDAFPLAHFTLYRSMRREPLPPPAAAPGPYPQWRAALDEKTYGRAVQWIREKIAAGDTYQVNYTFNLHADFAGDAHAWLRHFWPRQRAAYAGLYQAGEFSILSLSPELFFELDGQRLITCPMKGTRRRGRWPAEDDALAAELHSSAKDRAENAMIVDLLRNDLGRVSATGSVRVTHPFAIERYPTVWQMTSTVEASTQADVPHILAALFPCGSVTGAPKVRTMQLIAEAEREPRGVYCGTLGWWGPGRRAVFNVAIRTLCIDHTGGRATYGIGGGITWDSDPAAEWRECAAKAAVVMPRPIFALLESMRYEGTVFLMEEHLRRMSCSAEYFGYPFDASAARQKIELCAAGLPSGAHKIRVLLDAAGGITVESAPLPPAKTFRIALAAAPIDPADVFLYHKTTHRAVYENALRDRPDCDDVVLWNPAGELTETTIANLCLKIDGRWLTPPVRCGLLPGTLRQHLLECGEIHEAVLTRADLARAEQIALINSVRGWIAAVVCE